MNKLNKNHVTISLNTQTAIIPISEKQTYGKRQKTTNKKVSQEINYVWVVRV